MSEVKNKYRYVLTDRFGTLEVAPLGEGDFSIQYEREDEGKYFYVKQFQGKITFTGVNLDEEGSKAIAEKCKAEGQALLVISGGKRINLTDKGFMYARSKPENLKKELNNAIDPLLK